MPTRTSSGTIPVAFTLQAQAANIAIPSLRLSRPRTLFPHAARRLSPLTVRASSTAAVPFKIVRKLRAKVDPIAGALPKTYLDAGPAAATAYVYHALEHDLDSTDRFQLYQYTVSFFLRHDEVARATLLYARMVRDGYLPSVSLRTQMRVIREAESLTPDEHEQVLLPIIGHAFDNKSYDDDALADLLQLLAEGVRVPPSFIDRVVHLFLSKRDPGFQLSAHTLSCIVRLHARAGDKEGAARWSSERLPPLPQSSSPRGFINPAPYTTLLRDLAHANPDDDLYNWALSEIESPNPSIRVDLPFLNAVLAHAFGQRHFDALFSLYAHMVEQRTPALTPDGHTFSTIFRAVHQTTCKFSRRSKRTRGMKPPENVPAPRAVFRDMLTCLAARTAPAPTPVLDALALRKALRAFMGQYDYPAALVAVRLLRTHAALVGPPTLPLYRVVVNALLGRVKVHLPRIALRPDPQRVWTYRFLGLGDLPPHLRTRPQFDMAMVHRVLLAGVRSPAGLGWIPAPDYAARREIPLEGLGGRAQRELQVPDQGVFEANGMPTALQLVGLEYVEEDRPFAVAPLERLLTRAMLASADMQDPEGFLSQTAAEAVAQATLEMVPRPEDLRKESAMPLVNS
ncbi:hypothetical protein BD311DRAFT_864912 [Dichomitus squalens]|uniref:Uncharacterized protein n=1 Tax=Dichomitus squalens TaxID=114155 RepID=A0A4V2K0J4_9APHY|nr:hypothetical protein BD311DRAFT_864912 [Dichomitus squalens]